MIVIPRPRPAGHNNSLARHLGTPLLRESMTRTTVPRPAVINEDGHRNRLPASTAQGMEILTGAGGGAGPGSWAPHHLNPGDPGHERGNRVATESLTVDNEPVHFLQICCCRTPGPGAPLQEATLPTGPAGRLHLVPAARGGGAVLVHQDVQVYAAGWSAAKRSRTPFKEGRHGYSSWPGAPPAERFALKAATAPPCRRGRVSLTASVPCEVLLFDLPRP